MSEDCKEPDPDRNGSWRHKQVPPSISTPVVPPPPTLAVITDPQDAITKLRLTVAEVQESITLLHEKVDTMQLAVEGIQQDVSKSGADEESSSY